MDHLLEYLVPSRARRAVLSALVGWRKDLSVRELSRVARVPFSGVQQELVRLRELGLARVGLRGAAYACRWNASAPGAALLGRLVGGSASPSPGVLVWNLRRWGAPLVDRGNRGRGMDLEETLAGALGLARQRPEVALVWPSLLARHRQAVRLGRLAALARRAGRKRELGFLATVAGRLLGDAELGRWAEKFRDGRVRTTEAFFDPHEVEGVQGRPQEPGASRLARLASRRTPAAARRFGFRVNLPLSSFESVFRKFGSLR